ncbi:MAG: cation transporter [Deltaproteobacteria bacterium HGW-Deltaproteobacteria-12]|jgi:cation diffusion facilitator family transporter|nr:MAG: cation transporter [Deltaproteobacteria bacterium HGW-Deltaproteobacteria-12]
MNFQKQKERVALLSVISNSALVSMKLVVGLMIGSVSIISEAVHSGVDLLASIIALFSVKTSSKPADKDHSFGHGKIENISGTVEALLIFVAAGWIIYEAIQKLSNPEPLDNLGWGIGIMLISTIANIFVSQRLFKIGRETDSIALQADAWHLRTDVYTSAGVMVGLAMMLCGQWFFPHINFYWLDSVAAIAVALLIIKAAYDLTVQSAGDLLDANLPSEEEEWIRGEILKYGKIFHGYHRLRTRKAGHFRFVEFHLKVEPQMTVADSHAITEAISQHIESRYPQTSVTIHVEPCDGNCDDNCREGCLLSEEKRREIQKQINVTPSVGEV